MPKKRTTKAELRAQMEAMNLEPLPSDSLDLSDTVEYRIVPYMSNSGTRCAYVTPKGIAAAHQMRSDGLSLSSIAFRLGMPERTLSDCRRRQPELNEALQTGHAKQQDELVRLLMQSARQGFAPAAMFLLKASHGFRENDVPQSNASNVVIHLPAAMSLEELKRLAEANVSPMQLPEPESMKALDQKETTYDTEGNEVEAS